MCQQEHCGEGDQHEQRVLREQREPCRRADGGGPHDRRGFDPTQRGECEDQGRDGRDEVGRREHPMRCGIGVQGPRTCGDPARTLSREAHGQVADEHHAENPGDEHRQS